MNRVITYIDGFNLYFGLRSKNWRRYYWLDLVSLSGNLLKTQQQLDAVHYFTTRIRNNRHNTADMQRQNTYLEALGTLPDLTTHFGLLPRKASEMSKLWCDMDGLRGKNDRRQYRCAVARRRFRGPLRYGNDHLGGQRSDYSSKASSQPFPAEENCDCPATGAAFK